MTTQVIAGSLGTVLAGIATSYGYGESDLKLVRNKATSLAGFMEAHGVERWQDVTTDLIQAWIWSPVRTPTGEFKLPSTNYARSRRGIALAVCKEAVKFGARLDPYRLVGDPIAATEPDAPTRLLTDEQLQRVCDRAASGTARSREPLLVAAMLSGASPEDAAAVRASDVDLDAKTIRFAAGSERVCALDEWSAHVFGAYLAANPTAPDERLCVESDTSHDNAVTSVTRRVGRILREAGLESRCGLSPRSIRLTAARRVFERDGIVAATRFLGAPSLDTTARVLAHDWQHRRPAPAADSGGALVLSDDDAAELSGSHPSPGADAVGDQR